MTAEDRSQEMLQQAKIAKVKMLQVAGKTTPYNAIFSKELEGKLLLHSVIVNEEFTLVGAHVNDITKAKIILGNYVDFSQLIAKDRVMENDNRMEFVTKNGQMYLALVEDREGTIINSFPKWEQVFRVFTAIYVERFPHRTKELIQYNHVIHSAVLSFIWDNVYGYDEDFRMYMAKHPGCSWGVILQQLWTLRIRDRFSTGCGGVSSGSSASSGRKICFKYNSGKCIFGVNCKFEHNCAICGKYGHGAHICHKGSGASPTFTTTTDRETGESRREDHNFDNNNSYK